MTRKPDSMNLTRANIKGDGKYIAVDDSVIRCSHCQKPQLTGTVGDGGIERKCSFCRKIFTVGATQKAGRQYRCAFCNKLIFTGRIGNGGAISKERCDRCKGRNSFKDL